MGKIAGIQLPNAEYAEKYGFRDPEQYAARTNNGLSKDIVLEICRIKNEPQYMTDIRLKALDVFMKKPLPSWGGDLSNIDFNKITYYIKPSEKMSHSWDEVPDNIRKTFERLGIPEAERKFLGGVGAQYECLSGDAKIMTNPEGPVSIKDIKEGDYVFALNEQTKKIEKRKVNKVMPKGINDIYELIVGTRRIKATKNHPFLAVTYQKKSSKNRGTFNLSWRSLGDLQKGDAIAVVKEFPMDGHPYILPKINVRDKNQYKFNPVKIPKKTSPLDRFTSEHLGFVPVKEITYAGKELVYDIEVDGVHNFVANGIIVHNSESVYHKLREDLAAQGVIFTDMGEAVKLYPEIVKKYFGTVVPMGDNKFAALNTAVWSGGSFIYVPKGVKVAVPLQAYFRINAQNMGQFERTLIIADEGAEVNYVEGCTAPTYSTDSLHAAVVEVIAERNAKIRYTTIQNWSNNVYNLVTKRAFAHENAIVEWIDGNLGSKLTMKYPSVYLVGEHAKADILSVAYAGNGQHQDAGAKVVHLAPNTTSRIISKSISKSNGRASYRGLVRIAKGATNAATTVRCDALILDDTARSDTYPTMQIEEELSTVAHEAYVGRIGEEQLFYLVSRGLSEEDAMAMIVLGFIAEFTKELPMEYAIELNKLIRMEMGGCI